MVLVGKWLCVMVIVVYVWFNILFGLYFLVLYCNSVNIGVFFLILMLLMVVVYYGLVVFIS